VHARKGSNWGPAASITDQSVTHRSDTHPFTRHQPGPAFPAFERQPHRAFYAPELAPELFEAVGGAESAAGLALAAGIGDVAKQVVGNAIGAQDGFSWKEVAMAALTAGVTQGVGSYLPNTGSTLGNMVLKRAVGNALSQAIGVTTGLQDHFSWKSVAATAVSTVVSQGLNQAMGYNPRIGGFDFGKSLLSGVAGALAGHAVRGGRITAASVAADAFGNVLGDSLAAANSSAYQGHGTPASPYVDPDTGEHIVFGKPYQPDFPQVQQFVGAFGGGSTPPRDTSGDILLAAGPGYTGLGQDRLTLASNVDVRGTPQTYSDAGGSADNPSGIDWQTALGGMPIPNASNSESPGSTAPNMYPDYDLGTKDGMRMFLDDVSWKRSAGESVSSDELNTAKTILSTYYGLDGSLNKALGAWDNLTGAQASDRFDMSTGRIIMYQALNEKFGTNIDFSALSRFEGGQQLNGYVPQKKNGEVLGNSGVTIATGFDIGQMNDNQLAKLGLPQGLTNKLSSYTELTKGDAVDALKDEPLSVTRGEAMKIDFAVKSLHLRSAIQSWNNSDSDVTFTDLTQAQQTVIFSRTFHQGIGMPNTLEAQNFYSAATQGNWQAAETALRNYPVSANWYKNRVGLEADLLLKERTR
jgi:hypothetical protein